MAKTYSISDAQSTLDYFKELSGVDPLTISSKPEDVYFRALLYKVLMDYNGMNDRHVEEFFKYKGVRRTRSAVYHAVKKIDIYYRNYPNFRTVYNFLFDDKLEEFQKINDKIRAKNQPKPDVVCAPEEHKDELQLLIDSLPNSRRDEIYEMVNLRVKSWQWKSRDKCTIIESSEGISGRTF